MLQHADFKGVCVTEVFIMMTSTLIETQTR